MTEISEADATKEFWDHVKTGSPAMLGVNAVDRHYQPMAAYGEEDSNQVWFFTRDDTELVNDVATNHDGRLILVSRDREVFADISGDLTIDRDQARIDKYWNPMASAWFPEGKDDPHLTMLRFEPSEGQVWIVKKGLLRMAFQVARANATKTKPDMGGTADVRFRN